jgi:pimeloyl-ACP methyl ester carboxylesterase
MFRKLIPELSKDYYVLAPDLPGFRFIDCPPRDRHAYTFLDFAVTLGKFVEKLNLKKFALYCFDYGAPTGYRLALQYPDRISALIIQNGNAYDEGLREFWEPIKKYWNDPSEANRKELHFLVESKATRRQYENGVSDLSLLDPVTWTVDQAGMDRAGNDEIHLDLFYDYRTNVSLYPRFQEFFQSYQPPTLIVWGKNDVIFPPEGADPYLRDIPKAKTILYDTGHFALETHSSEIGQEIRCFLRDNNI